MYHVLIADDEAAVCKGLEKLIDWEKYNFKVTAYAYDGREALNKINCGDFDLVLTDIRMPILDGIQLVESLIAANFPGKIIVLSAFPEFEYARKLMSFGVKHYILKPVNQKVLEDILHDITKELDRTDASLKKKWAAMQKSRDIQLEAPSKREDSQNGNTPSSSIESILKYIEMHYMIDISLVTIAKKFYVNPVYLGRLFASVTGQKFTEYLNMLRVNKAAELLTYSDCLIYEICSNVGYQDLNYFYKVFKKHKGVTPTEYRRNTQEK